MAFSIRWGGGKEETNFESLPILVQPEFIKKALLAGKHVLSEKPIAKDLATAQDLVKWYQANVDTSTVSWAVAENYRYFRKFLYTAEQVQKLGAVKNFRVINHTMVKTDFKYYRESRPFVRETGTRTMADYARSRSRNILAQSTRVPRRISTRWRNPSGRRSTSNTWFG